MNRQPRKLKKAIKKAIIIYDVSAVPKGMSLHDLWWETWKEHGLLLYDSNEGNCPEFANRVGMRVRIVDKNKLL